MPVKRLPVIALRRGEGLGRRFAAVVGQARRRGVPIDVAQRDGRAFHFAGGRGAGDEQGKADKYGTFQQTILVRPRARA